MAAIDQVQQVIANAITTANEAAANATAYTNAAQTAAGGAFFPAPVDVVVIKDVENPAFKLADLTKEVTAAFADGFKRFESNLLAFGQEFGLSGDPPYTKPLASFINDHFPGLLRVRIRDASDTWLAETIESRGHSAAQVDYERALWARERDREIEDSERLEQDAISDFASRGFSMPAGILVARVDRIRGATAKNIAAASREAAIKSFDIANENVKFAVETGVRLRLAVITALMDFLRLYATTDNQAREYATLVLNSRTALWNAANDLYRAQMEEERMRIDVDTTNRKVKADFALAEFRNYEANIKARVDAAIGGAEAMGRLAAAALSSQNTISQISHETTKSE